MIILGSLATDLVIDAIFGAQATCIYEVLIRTRMLIVVDVLDLILLADALDPGRASSKPEDVCIVGHDCFTESRNEGLRTDGQVQSCCHGVLLKV